MFDGSHGEATLKHTLKQTNYMHSMFIYVQTGVQLHLFTASWNVLILYDYIDCTEP